MAGHGKSLGTRVNAWLGQCARKKKLKPAWADQIIAEAAKTGATLYKYSCPHCFGWHVTKMPRRVE